MLLVIWIPVFRLLVMVRMGETGFMEWTEHKSLSITNKYIKFDNTIRIFIIIDVFALENALIGVGVWIYFMP
ncbi:hypothetical protein AWU48_15335 [Acinetobacter baumannii]|nr:hypothetical protein AWU48_15335 [Acinetobacter baumannii]